jgi:hypothetical protein
MKKNIFKAFVVLSALSFATSAFAATFNDSNTTIIGGGTFKVSKSVTLQALATTAAYAAIAGHLNGDKAYGTNSTDPKIFEQTKTKGAAVSAPSSATYDFASGWQ